MSTQSTTNYHLCVTLDDKSHVHVYIVHKELHVAGLWMLWATVAHCTKFLLHSIFVIHNQWSDFAALYSRLSLIRASTIRDADLYKVFHQSLNCPMHVSVTVVTRTQIIQGIFAAP